MDCIKITGGNKLYGEIPISGAKNAALPLMISSLLTEEILTLENVPNLIDVKRLVRILEIHGVKCSVENDPNTSIMSFHANRISTSTAPYDLSSKMRASFWLIGPLLARIGEAKVSFPGGCAIGTRPVNFILDGLRKLGVDINVCNGYINAKVPKELRGAKHIFPKITVGGTHVMIMVACLAKGDTILHNAACEPEVTNLIECLKKMGAHIKGAGTSNISIHGVSRLSGAKIKIVPDRIEAATYAMAIAMTGGDVLLKGLNPNLLGSSLQVLKEAGVDIILYNNNIRIRRKDAILDPVNVSTAPFPGFPTDMQAQLTGLMTKANGVSYITETIFENRFMHVQELVRLGADISLFGQTAKITGVKNLQGAQVMATDLRASVSLVIAGLVAKGTTIINRIYHLDRGFEKLEQKLSRCGAKIKRIYS